MLLPTGNGLEVSGPLDVDLESGRCTIDGLDLPTLLVRRFNERLANGCRKRRISIVVIDEDAE
jgi:hypothetical protein